eukprot:3032227-Alexandrium_andersonii.AAC.1
MSGRQQTPTRSSRMSIRLHRGHPPCLPTTPYELPSCQFSFLPSGMRRPHTRARTPRTHRQGAACPS